MRNHCVDSFDCVCVCFKNLYHKSLKQSLDYKSPVVVVWGSDGATLRATRL